MPPEGRYWHVAIEPTQSKAKAGGHTAIALDRDRDWVERRVLDPRRRGEPISMDGQTFAWEEVVRLRIAVSEEPSDQIIARLRAEAQASSVMYIGGPGYRERVPYNAADVTDELLDAPPGSLASGTAGEAAAATSDPRAVMVVYGRNGLARRAMFDFLRALNLQPLEWSELVSGTQAAAPYVGEVLEHAFQRARAVVVLLTPDDEAQLRGQFRSDHEPAYETTLTGQARPTVLFEAGMAFGVHPERTVIVELGDLRPFSDIAGRHTVRLDATDGPLREIARRLETAKCDVDTSGDDWADGTRFAPALDAAKRTAAAAPHANGEAGAILDVLDELATIELRVDRARREGYYPHDFLLPAGEYHDHKDRLVSVVRDKVAPVYVTADDLNTDVQRRGEEARVLDEDDLPALLHAIDTATQALRERLHQVE